MPIRHEVEPGECLATIAHRFGLRDPEAVFAHPDNEDLRARRASPYVLLPGDVVVIPDAKARPIEAEAEKVHTFVVPARKQTLRVVLQDHRGKPRAGVAWELRAEGRVLEEDETSDDGLVEARLPIRLRTVTLVEGGEATTLHIGRLDPVRDAQEGRAHAAGVKARLRGLGHRVSKIDDVLDGEARRAIRAFQRAHGLEVTGEADADLLNALAREYGC
jgi:hypothetical protein